ncbi:uncharacterized protein FIBRA_06240 [Fibroporia radiculosa]|uniref:Uncharacterized protein n=1 Tax=Fibroporia radiculosa TaxID=599839 RepID=J4IB57_9APHY|nr:uncharacterized protein FIBRA_06240 [Fibroporia radiculosa]CCM04081.1 predicted protein [Fibroporia radiculosa]
MAVFSVISDAVYMIVNVVISYMLILAISHGNQTLSVITLLMGLGSVGLSLCQHASMHFLSMYGVCWSSITLKFTEDDFVIIGSTYAICALFCNLIVIVSAWFYLHRSLLSEGVLRRTNTVAGTLLKDGTMYFMALSALHFQYVIDYACTFTCNPSGDLYNILAVTSGPSQLLPSILLSRLLLHLHEASSGEYSGTHNGGTHTGTWLQDLEFARSQILSSELVPQSSANEAEVMDADGAGYNDPENGMNQEE